MIPVNCKLRLPPELFDSLAPYASESKSKEEGYYIGSGG